VSDETSTTGPGGRYELLELLEEGICGKLYRARDAREDRPVLVKLITRSVSKDPEFRRYAYDRWAERDALFEHPNIVTIVEVGKSGEQYFLAVEEPEGERLCERMKEAPLDTDEVVEILRQIAEALRAAHRRQVVHGYLKPSDVFLTRDPSGRLLVKVLFLDLGTSAAESVLPMFGEVHGSPKYMAPEVIRGATPGVQSDVFALGVIGYELLTGREPFAAEHPIGYLFANCETPLVPPHLVNEKVPREVSLVVSRCLEKDPERRYRSAQRVIDDLERCEEVTKTGKVSIVPRGSDSAFAREYELPELEKREKAPARTSATSLVALVLALAALGVTIVWNYTSLLRPGAEERQEHPVGITPPERPGRHGEQPPREAGPTQQAREAAARAQRARSAYEAARKDWTQRLSLRGAYELGVAKFEEIAADYAGTPAAEQARQAAAEVYCEWAEVLAEKGDLKDLEEAEAKYRRAMQMAPESEPLRQVFELKVPPVMAQRAAALEGLRRYAEALALYRDIRKEFPGSVAAALLPRKEPGLLLKYGSMRRRRPTGTCRGSTTTSPGQRSRGEIWRMPVRTSPSSRPRTPTRRSGNRRRSSTPKSCSGSTRQPSGTTRRTRRRATSSPWRRSTRRACPPRSPAAAGSGSKLPRARCCSTAPPRGASIGTRSSTVTRCATRRRSTCCGR